MLRILVHQKYLTKLKGQNKHHAFYFQKLSEMLHPMLISNSKMKMPRKYCPYCGIQFVNVIYPITCKCCNNKIPINPIPIAVGLLPFYTDYFGTGLLLVNRAINPFIGEVCFPSGYIGYNESWEKAISREIFEETTIITTPEEFELINVSLTLDNTRILIFGVSKCVRTIDELKNYKPGRATSDVNIGIGTDKLCFSLHQNVYDMWFVNKSKTLE